MKRFRRTLRKGLVFGFIVATVLLSAVKQNWFAITSFVIFELIIYCFIGGIIPYILLGICGVATLYHLEDYLLFHPNLPPHSRVIVSVPSVFGLPYESVYTHTSDGVQLHLLVILQSNAPKAAPTVLYLHGNAGNVGHRLQNAAELYKNLKCNIVMLEYRGYGLSSGRPSENGMYIDAAAALDFIASRREFNHDEIIVFGRSLGGAIAIDLSIQNLYKDKIWCLIVENTFTSIPEMANVLIGWRVLRQLPLICYKNKFSSSVKVTKLEVPVMFISGLADTLVPPWMMAELHRLCRSPKKQLVQFAGGTHNETWNCKGYYCALENFVNEIRQQRTTHNEKISVVT